MALTLKEDGKRRLFVDPASISAGWALFQGATLVSQGTVAVSQKLNVFERLSQIYERFFNEIPSGFIDEIHIEQLPRRVHHYTMWSVGVIGMSLHRLLCPSIRDDIPVPSWQKACQWRADEGESWVQSFSCKSQDEAAAIAMGYYYLSTRLQTPGS